MNRCHAPRCFRGGGGRIVTGPQTSTSPCRRPDPMRTPPPAGFHPHRWPGAARGCAQPLPGGGPSGARLGSSMVCARVRLAGAEGAGRRRGARRPLRLRQLRQIAMRHRPDAGGNISDFDHTPPVAAPTCRSRPLPLPNRNSPRHHKGVDLMLRTVTLLLGIERGRAWLVSGLRTCG